MILLQILTGRRASEIRTCDARLPRARHRRHDQCQPPEASRSPGSATPKARSTSRRTASSSTTRSPPSSRSSEHWLREHASRPARHGTCSCNARATATATSPTQQAPTAWMLRRFSDLVQITDSKGRAVRLSHTHRFRHTKLTRLAELGLPDPRPAALRRPRHADDVHALHRPARGARRAGVPGHRQAARRRHPGAVLPRGPRQPAPVRPRRPVPAPRLVPAAPAADLQQGQRLPDLLGLRHRRHPSRHSGATAGRHRAAHRPDHRRHSSSATASPCPTTTSG